MESNAKKEGIFSKLSSERLIYIYIFPNLIKDLWKDNFITIIFSKRSWQCIGNLVIGVRKKILTLLYEGWLLIFHLKFSLVCHVIWRWVGGNHCCPQLPNAPFHLFLCSSFMQTCQVDYLLFTSLAFNVLWLF